MRHRQFLCCLCARVFDGGGGTCCEQCDADSKKLYRLYHEIIFERKHLQTKTMVEVFTALWKRFKELEAIKAPQSRTKSKSPRD